VAQDNRDGSKEKQPLRPVCFAAGQVQGSMTIGAAGRDRVEGRVV
jgi:hypothetical protein